MCPAVGLVVEAVLIFSAADEVLISFVLNPLLGDSRTLLVETGNPTRTRENCYEESEKVVIGFIHKINQLVWAIWLPRIVWYTCFEVQIFFSEISLVSTTVNLGYQVLQNERNQGISTWLASSGSCLCLDREGTSRGRFWLWWHVEPLDVHWYIYWWTNLMNQHGFKWT